MHPKWNQLLLLAAASGMIDVAFSAPVHHSISNEPTLSIRGLNIASLPEQPIVDPTKEKVLPAPAIKQDANLESQPPASSEASELHVKRDPMFKWKPSPTTEHYEPPPNALAGALDGHPAPVLGSKVKLATRPQEWDSLEKLPPQKFQDEYDDILLRFYPTRRYDENSIDDALRSIDGQPPIYNTLNTRKDQEDYLRKLGTDQQAIKANSDAIIKAEMNWDKKVLPRPMSSSKVESIITPWIKKGFPEADNAAIKKISGYFTRRNKEFEDMQDPALAAQYQQRFLLGSRRELEASNPPPRRLEQEEMNYQISQALPKGMNQDGRDELLKKYSNENKAFYEINADAQVVQKQKELLDKIRMLYSGDVLKGPSKRAVKMALA